MNFTDSPYEKMMKQVPRPSQEGAVQKPPRRSSCRECGYWDGRTCVGVCYRELIVERKVGTSGQHGPKSP
jgi:hypothetical protein